VIISPDLLSSTSRTTCPAYPLNLLWQALAEELSSGVPYSF